MEIPFLRLIAGVLLLFLGRRLFWLFVGLLGFLSGAMVGAHLFSNFPDWALLLIAIVCGLFGVLLAIFVQRLAIAIAGFLAGGLFSSMLAESLNWSTAGPIIFVIGGILGAIMISILFDWALIVLSSITGAILVARWLPVEPSISGLAFIILLVLGIFVQARFLQPSPQRKTET